MRRICIVLVVFGLGCSDYTPRSAPATPSDDTDTSTSAPADVAEEGATNIAGPAAGKIQGRDFKPDSAELSNGILTLRQGEGVPPDLAVKIFLFLDEGESPEGKSYQMTPETGPGSASAHVHLSIKQPGETLPETEVFGEGYEMTLQFGEAKGNKLPGKIDLRLPDESESFVRGTFSVDVAEDSSP